MHVLIQYTSVQMHRVHCKIYKIQSAKYKKLKGRHILEQFFSPLAFHPVLLFWKPDYQVGLV